MAGSNGVRGCGSPFARGFGCAKSAPPNWDGSALSARATLGPPLLVAGWTELTSVIEDWRVETRTLAARVRRHGIGDERAPQL